MRCSEHLLFAIACLHIVSFCVAQQSVGDTCRGAEGEKGVCQFIRDCPGVEDDIKKGIRPKLCGFQDKDPFVCCIATGPQKVTRAPGETAQKWCEEYKTSCSKHQTMYKLQQKPVAGGHPADSKEFPHMAAIGYGDENDIKWHCGGTLISEKFVLTAAHCDSSPSVGPAKWVLLGTILLFNSTASRGRIGQIHPVIRRIRHPEYKPPAKYNDISLFEIGPAVTPHPRPLNRKELHPACLSSNRTFAGSEAIATGWGRIGFADDGSPNLLKVKLDVFDLSVCQEAYDTEVKTSVLQNGIVPTMLCAGVLEGKRDTCQGDSGGPLQVPLDSSRCMYEVWGVTSFGKVCAFPNSPSVYSKVFEYVPWIEDIVWPA